MSKSYTLQAVTDHPTVLRWVRAEWYSLNLGRFVTLDEADEVVFDVRIDGGEWESVEAAQVGSTSDWNVEYVFETAGRYTVIPKATIDDEYGYGKAIKVTVEDL